MENETDDAGNPDGPKSETGWFKPSDAHKAIWPARKESAVGGAEEPRAQIVETDKEVILALELPGVRREEIKINACEDRIDITVERTAETESGDTEGAEYFYASRHFGFSGSYCLPARIRPDEIKAAHRDGILQISAPKACPAGGKEIKID